MKAQPLKYFGLSLHLSNDTEHFPCTDLPLRDILIQLFCLITYISMCYFALLNTSSCPAWSSLL